MLLMSSTGTGSLKSILGTICKVLKSSSGHRSDRSGWVEGKRIMMLAEYTLGSLISSVKHFDQVEEKEHSTCDTSLSVSI